MNNQLTIVSEDRLPKDIINTIDTEIDNILEKSKNNRVAINQLTFESIQVLTTIKNDEMILANKDHLALIIENITGTYQAAQNSIDMQQVIAQEIGQRILNKLVERNDLTLDLVEAIHFKLNTLIPDVQTKIRDIWNGLNQYVVDNKRRIAGMAQELEDVKRTGEMILWATTSEYYTLDGISYRDLDVSSKIICIVSEFFNKTKGQYSAQELLLLQGILDKLGIEYGTSVNYGALLKRIADNPVLEHKLLNGSEILNVEFPEQLSAFSLMKKKKLLQTDEYYIVDMVQKMMQENNIDESVESIIDKLASRYLAETALTNLDVEMPAFEVVGNLLHCLSVIETYKGDMTSLSQYNDEIFGLTEEMVKACELFWKCNLKEALPIFKGYADKGNTNAMYFLSRYPKIDPSLVSEKEGRVWAQLGASKGNLLCKSVDLRNGRMSFYNDDDEMYYEKISSDLHELGHELINLNENTILDAFYSYEGACCLKDYELMRVLGDNGCWLAWIDLGRFYRAEENVEENVDKLLECYNKAVKCGCNYALFDIAWLYNFEVKDKKLALSNYKKYYELDLPLAGNAANLIGILMADSDKYNAVKWFEKAVEKGYSYGYSNLAESLVESDPHNAVSLFGKAFDMFKDTDKEKAGHIACRIGEVYSSELNNLEKAIEWYKKSADLGDCEGIYYLGLAYKYVNTHITKRLTPQRLNEYFHNCRESFYWLYKATKLGVEEAETRIRAFAVADTEIDFDVK